MTILMNLNPEIIFINSILEYVNPIKVCVTITLLFALLKLDRKNSLHRNVLIILFICFLTELINTYLKYNGNSNAIFSSISIIFHNSFWLLLLSKVVHYKKLVYILILGFILFSLFNLSFIEKFERFNYYSFILGALFYVLIFFYESFFQLKNENFEFFSSNNFLILFAPVIFFLGISLMFAFNSVQITSTIVFGQVTLYKCIIYFVNLFYYALINSYIYKESKL
jgi:hypothetical protein